MHSCFSLCVRVIVIVAWMRAWRHGVDLGMPRLRQCSCKGCGPSGVQGIRGALESLEEHWTHLMEHP
jgi:hypothetical protein